MSSSLTQSFQIDTTALPPETVLFGSTDAMREVWVKVNCVLDNDLPVLIKGESGTGKELMARFLHTHSHRRHAAFVKFNCGAMPAGLLEAELMGLEKGWSAGSDELICGLVEVAETGTLFLDEIGDMESPLQRKMLRLLQDGHYSRIGGIEERKSKARIIAASNIEMEAEAGAGAFRKDLFDRVDWTSLQLAPLRDRKLDIPQLCEFLIQKQSRRLGKSSPRLSTATLQLLAQWHWPGNVRELENWVARVIILGSEEVPMQELKTQLASAHLASSTQTRTGRMKELARASTAASARDIILRALHANRGNRRTTAEQLNISYRSLLYKLREVNVRPRRRT